MIGMRNRILQSQVRESVTLLVPQSDVSTIEFAFKLNKEDVEKVVHFLRYRRFTQAHYVEGILSGKQSGKLYIELQEFQGYLETIGEGDFAISDSRYIPKPVVLRVRGKITYCNLDSSFSILEELRVRSDPLWGLAHENILVRKHTKETLADQRSERG